MRQGQGGMNIKHAFTCIFLHWQANVHACLLSDEMTSDLPYFILFTCAFTWIYISFEVYQRSIYLCLHNHIHSKYTVYFSRPVVYMYLLLLVYLYTYMVYFGFRWQFTYLCWYLYVPILHILNLSKICRDWQILSDFSSEETSVKNFQSQWISLRLLHVFGMFQVTYTSAIYLCWYIYISILYISGDQCLSEHGLFSMYVDPARKFVGKDQDWTVGNETTSIFTVS